MKIILKNFYKTLNGNKYTKYLKYIIPCIVLFFIMGSIYYGVEIMWDGMSHWSMFALGGLCGVAIGLLNEHVLKWDMSLIQQVLIGDAIVLVLEFFTGLIVNVWLGLNIWDYSALPFNIMGQSSLLFAFLFMPLVLICIVLDDWIRFMWFDGEYPTYRLI